jgi:DNA-binding CsgD family transcriptional regulator
MADFDQPSPRTRAEGVHAALEEGRQAYERRAWADAHRSLSLADQSAPLGVEDLERLATSAHLIGHDDHYLKTLERAHLAHLDSGETPRAVRCAFWLGLRLFLRRETGPATGWLARAQRLLEREARECVERGYLLLPGIMQRIEEADWEAALAMATAAAEIGNRFREADLSAAARLFQGRVLLRQARVEEGLALLDETMIAVTAGELSPVATGLVYCSVIDGCQQVYALGRAQQWTAALHDWCAEQPGLIFTGRCLVHRAEIMQLHGAWPDAIEEARRASERLSQWSDQQAAAAAFYQEAEVHRLRGEYAEAEQAYRSASQWGWDPQPGLALLRLAQGRVHAAAAAIRRAVSATTDRLQRVRLLPAYVEIMLASGDIETSHNACSELEAIAGGFDAAVLGALAAHAAGAVALAEGDAEAALRPLRSAFEAWRQVEAPYLAARVRVQIGLACRVLGDHDGAALEWEAARSVFEKLGAVPDLGRLDSLTKDGPFARPHGLTRRELQVLRLIAAGKTNKAIAGELFVSEKTVDRHVSNIFTKLDVPSRSAATAYAYEHKLV